MSRGTASSGEDRIFAKCAWRLIPFMMLLYLVNFLDRLNVGIAALTMNRDLGFTPQVYGFGAGVFFLSYAVSQVPANVLLDRLGARRWIFCILAVWGVISASTALVRGPPSFYVLRFLLGVAEAGFFPGMIFYLTLWFPHAYRGRFCALFSSAIPLSGIVGGPLSVSILRMDGMAGLHGWQWLFLVEGIPAFLLAFAVLKLMPDGPAQASWLNDSEKSVVAARLVTGDSAKQRNLGPALRDPRLLALSLAGISGGASLYGTTLWLPQIVQAMGFSNFATGFVVTLPYAAGMAAMILWGRSSDRRNERVWHIVLAYLVSAFGFAVASLAPNYVLVLAGLTVALTGTLALMGPFYSLPSLFLGGAAAAAGVALVNVGPSIGGFVGPSVIGVLRQQTGGYASSMAILAVTQVVAALIVFGVGRTVSPSPSAIPMTRH